VFTATVPNNNYLAIGFGTSMFGTNMISFQANGDESFADNLYAIQHAKPDSIDRTVLTTTTQINPENVIFTVKRKFDTGLDNGYVI
jgi:hypothetical protein